ncbi:MAG: type II toxin-antitoxin system VapC family toxin [Candidatus Bathyarchaeia archaeon]
MSYDFVIDSYAWIEYFRGSTRGALAKPYIEEENSVTPTIVIAEISRKLLNEILEGRETMQGREEKLDFIKTSTFVMDLTIEIAKLAGEIDIERRRVMRGWGLSDSIILATARRENAKVITGDKHFADLKDEIILI